MLPEYLFTSNASKDYSLYQFPVENAANGA